MSDRLTPEDADLIAQRIVVRVARLFGMKTPALALVLLSLLSAACATPVAVTSSPAPSPTVAATTAVTTTVPIITPAPAPAFAASECTNATVSTRQVIERYFALSTSNNAQAVIDCFAKVWRERNATGVNVNTFTDGAARWSQAGPASGLVITFIDAVNGCDRFGVRAQMATYGTNNAFSVPPFFTVGPEGGTPRIFETGTGLVNPQSATTTCK